MLCQASRKCLACLEALALQWPRKPRRTGPPGPLCPWSSVTACVWLALLGPPCFWHYGPASAAYSTPPQVWTHLPPSLSLLWFPLLLTPAVSFSLIFPTLLCLAASLSLSFLIHGMGLLIVLLQPSGCCDASTGQVLSEL